MGIYGHSKVEDQIRSMVFSIIHVPFLLLIVFWLFHLLLIFHPIYFFIVPPMHCISARSLELAASRQGEDTFCLLRLSVGSQKWKAQIRIQFALKLKRTQGYEKSKIQRQQSCKLHQKACSLVGGSQTSRLSLAKLCIGWSVRAALAKAMDVSALIL